MKKITVSIILVLTSIFNFYILIAENALLETYSPKIVIDALVTGDAQLGSQPGNFIIHSETDYGVSIQPSDMDFDGEGNIYIFDPGNNRIQEFGKNGVYVKSIPVNDCYKSEGEGKPLLNYKREFKIGKDGSYLVLDSGAKEIIKIDEYGNELEKYDLSSLKKTNPDLFADGIHGMRVGEDGMPFFEEIYFDELMKEIKVKNIIKIGQGKQEISAVNSLANLGIRTDKKGKKYEINRIAINKIEISKIGSNIKVNVQDSKPTDVKLLGEDMYENIFIEISSSYLGVLKYDKKGVLIAKIIDIGDFWYKGQNVVPIKESVWESLYVDNVGNFYIARILPAKNKFQVIRWSK